MTFTCQTSTSLYNWVVTPDGGTVTTCTAVRLPMPLVTDPTCGPNEEFSVNITEDGSSTLTTQSVDESLNNTRIQCLDEDVDQEICILGWIRFCESYAEL